MLVNHFNNAIVTKVPTLLFLKARKILVVRQSKKRNKFSETIETKKIRLKNDLKLQYILPKILANQRTAKIIMVSFLQSGLHKR